jgi:hypothetical protein
MILIRSAELGGSMRQSHAIRRHVCVVGGLLLLLAQGCSTDNNNPVGGGPVTVPLIVEVDGSATDGVGLATKDGVADAVSTSGVIEVAHAVGPLVQWESRGMWEFDLESLNVDINQAVLALAVDDDRGPFPFDLAVYGYAGDGAITASDFAAGTRLGTLSYDQAPAIGIDVTAFVQARLVAGDRWAGFTIHFSPPSAIDTNGPFVTFGAREGGPGPAQLLLEIP